MLEMLIPSALRRRILSIFFTNVDSEFHIREVCRRTESPGNAVKDELESLERAGILKSKRRGNMNCFSINKSSPIFPELHSIILKTEGIAGVLRSALKGLKGVRFAFIYGSFAKGDEKPGSDIDLMIIGPAMLAEAYAAARMAERLLSREVSCTIYPDKEFLKKRKGGFISEVIRSRKVWIVGDEDEFERFAEGRAH